MADSENEISFEAVTCRKKIQPVTNYQGFFLVMVAERRQFLTLTNMEPIKEVI